MKRLASIALACLPALAAAAGSIYQSRHNLSATGPGSVRAVSEKRACVFCHVAHSPKPGGENRPESQAQVRPYGSSTLASRMGAGPAGAGTRICLSCHDGTIAVGKTLKGSPIRMEGTDPTGRMQAGRANLGFDLAGSHPVAFKPTHAGRTRDPQPEDDVKLDRQGMVQCTSCHDPHAEDNDPDSRKFLVKGNRASKLCLSCHLMPLWQTNPASHQASLASPFPPDAPVPAGAYRTLADTGCATCHSMHAGRPGQSLAKGDAAAGDDRLCLGCHDGRVARTDLAAQVARPYAHAAPPVATSGHDAGEGPANPARTVPESRPSQARHVTCADCHNPHAAFKRPTEVQAPRAPGVLSGVWGIDRNNLKVDPVNYEYEVCFKCHADSANQPQARPTAAATAPAARRAIPDVNLRRVFDLSAPSFHPVEGPGRSTSVPGLLPLPGSTQPLTAASVIYCGDCHASSDPAGGRVPRGPHGSSFEHLLERAYVTADPSPYSPAAYALCFKCHDPNVLLVPPATVAGPTPLRAAPGKAIAAPARGAASVALPVSRAFAATAGTVTNFPGHWLHVVRQSTSCSACHNPHGVSALAGNPVNNAHLVDFDVSVVSPNAQGLRQYTSKGPASGSCSLTCHGKQHDNLGY